MMSLHCQYSKVIVQVKLCTWMTHNCKRQVIWNNLSFHVCNTEDAKLECENDHIIASLYLLRTNDGT